MSDTKPLPQTDRIDALLRVLADGERRAILAHLRETPRAIASLEDLTIALAAYTGRGREHARTRLHHSHLPVLADRSLLEYDVDASTVRYRGTPGLESLLETVHTVEAATTSSRTTTDHEHR